MRAHLPSLSSAKERIKSRIRDTKQSADNKTLAKSSGDEFEESTADLTSSATSYQFPQTPQSSSRTKADGPTERVDCYQSVVSDITWQDQEIARSVGRRRNSLSSLPFVPAPPSASASAYNPYHQHSADDGSPSPRLGSPPKNPSQNHGNSSTMNSKPQVARPQHRQRRRASMSSVVSDLTWNEPLPQEPSLLDEPADTSYRAYKLQRQQSYDESVSSLVSDITWMDLDNSTIGRPSNPNPNTKDLSAHSASTPDSRSRSPDSSSGNNMESSLDSKTPRQQQPRARGSSSFHDSTISELSWMNSESSLKISDLMRSSIMEAVNEGSGTPSTSDGSKEVNDAVGILPTEEELAKPVASSPEMNKMKPKLEMESVQTTTELSSNHATRKQADAMPRIPMRKSSTSGRDMLRFADPDCSDDSLEPKKVSKSKKASKKSKEAKAGDKALPQESEHSVDSVSKKKKKKGTKTKAGGAKPKTKKSKKKSKKILDESSEPSSDPVLDRKPKKKGKKKKPKDSERSKLDDSEHGSQFDFDGTLNKKPSKKSKKKTLDDSEHSFIVANDSDGTFQAKTTTNKVEKKLEDSDRSLFGGSDRSNFSSCSTFDVGELPDLKEIGTLKKRDDLDTSNHSVQSACEFGSAGQKVPGKRSRRSRNSDLDSSNHSVQSCLEMETTRFSTPRPSALSNKPLRPAFRPKVSTNKKSKRKSVTFADGEPSRPLIPIAKKEMTRDWGETNLDRLPSSSMRDVSSQSPPSLPHRRVSKGLTDSSNEVKPVAKPPRNVHSQSKRVDGVNFLLDRLSTIVHDSDSEVPVKSDVAPSMPRPRLSQDSPDILSPTAVKDLLGPSTPPVLGTPKISARDQLGLKRVEEAASLLVTPTGRILGKHRMEKRRKESSVRKSEVFEAMNSMMIDESEEMSC